MKKIFLLSVLFIFSLIQTHGQSAGFTSDSPRCANDTVHFTPDPPGGSILREEWDFGDGTTATYLPPTTFPVFATHLYASPGTYNVTRTVKFSTGVLTHNLLATVKANPTANFMWSVVACANQPVQFTDLSLETGGGSIQSWNWNFGDPASGVNNNSSMQNPSHAYSSGGTYNVALTVTSSNGCVNTILKVITINILPVANFTNTVPCEGGSTQFTDLSIANAAAIVSYTWDFGDGGTSTLSSPMHIYTTYGLFSTTLTVVNSNGCVNSITKPVTVYPKPVPAFSFPAVNCSGSPVSFTDLSFIAAGFPSYIINWVWEFGDGTPPLVINFPNNPSVLHTFAGSATAHVVRLTTTTTNGCSAYIEKIVTSFPVPVANFQQTGASCQLQPVQFADLSQTNGGTTIVVWNWDFGDPLSGVNNTSAAQNPTHVFSVPGMFMVTLGVINSNGCSDTISKAITVNALPVANFTADTVHLGTATAFTDQSSAGIGIIVNWLWEFGDGQTSSLNNPVHAYAVAATYMAKLTVTGNYGCTNDTTKPVIVLAPVNNPPATQTITNIIVGNGQTKCYNATQVITVAGNGTLFYTLSGGNTTLIAGQRISLLPGTTVQYGGYLHGHIAASGPWCQFPSIPSAAVVKTGLPGGIIQSSLKIYPNPTTGYFFLELPDETPAENVQVDIYGMRGEKVLKEFFKGERKHEISLLDQPGGIYFIRVTTGRKTETVKVIKNQ